MRKLGFVGLGIMGAPMAGRLLAAGHQVFVYARKDLPAELVAKGPIKCGSAKDVAAACEIFFVMTPDTPDVDAVLFGESGAAEGLSRGKIVVDMSSISPIETKQYGAKIEALGCEYLDAPVSGGEVGAKAGTLSIMVGGKDEVFAKVQPLFELMGKNITLVGGIGAGQTAKVANQMIVAMTIEAVAEALLFAARAGADPAPEGEQGPRDGRDPLPLDPGHGLDHSFRQDEGRRRDHPGRRHRAERLTLGSH